MKHEIRFQDAIPAALWQERPGPLADFIKNERLDWENELIEKMSDLRDLESWLKSLNESPKGPKVDS